MKTATFDKYQSQKTQNVEKQILSRSKAGRQKVLKQMLTKRRGLIDIYQREINVGNVTAALEAKLTANKKSILDEIQDGQRELVSRHIRTLDGVRSVKSVKEEVAVVPKQDIKSLKRFDLGEFKGLVEAYFNFPFEDIISRSRKREYVDIRSTLFPILEHLVGSATMSGRLLGGRDHATALHNKKTFENNCEVDSIYRQQACGFIEVLMECGYEFPQSLYKVVNGQVYVMGFAVKVRAVPSKNEEKVSLKISEAAINHFDYNYFESRKVLMLS